MGQCLKHTLPPLQGAETYAGGIRVPLIVSWPQGLAREADDDGIRTQYQYVTDLTPTLLELAGLPHPGTRRNLPAKEVDGASFASILPARDAPSTHPEQYTEFGGNRGFYREGWKIVADHEPGVPLDDGHWELYHVAEDPNELHDVAAEHPGKLRELAAGWEHAAWHNTVFPVDDRSSLSSARRRPAEAEFEKPVTLLPGTPKLERYRSSKLTTLRNFEVEVRLQFSPGDEGILVAHGDQGGGYALYIRNGHLYFVLNEYGRLHDVDAGPLEPGARRITLRTTLHPGFRAEHLIAVDGDTAARLRDVWALIGFAPFSGIDVGLNRGGPVHWGLHEEHGPFAYSGQLESVRYIPGDKAPYDPEVLATLERDTESAGD